jgi:regulatory protein
VSHSPPRRPPKPLDAATLEALALHYVGRYATTRAKLRTYLHRKLRERGWAGEDAAPTETIIQRLAGLGYVDDRVFAELRGAGLSRRGFGKRRIDEALRHAGVALDDVAEVAEDANADRDWEAIIRLARRRRIGPFAATQEDRDAQRRTLAILLRAGHEYANARRLLALSAEEIAALERL